jgi:hypothetical protein
MVVRKSNLEELKLEEFANALIRALPKFTAANFFEVNKSSIWSFLCIVTSFLIVMFQIQIRNEIVRWNIFLVGTRYLLYNVVTIKSFNPLSAIQLVGRLSGRSW